MTESERWMPTPLVTAQILPRIVAYKTAHGNDRLTLDEHVNALLTEGWQPFGGGYAIVESLPECHPDTLVLYYQPMVKYA